MNETALTFVVTCKARLAFLKQSLPALLSLPGARCVFVDYDCPEKSGDWVEQTFPQVRVVRISNRPLWNSGEAKNLGAGVVETPWICFTDADILFHPTFIEFLTPMLRPGRCFRVAQTRVGIFGTMVIARQDFERVGGYDEAMRNWGCDDNDLMERLEANQVVLTAFPDSLLTHIEHGNDLRLKFADDMEIMHSWCVNRAYCLAKAKLMDNLKAPLDLPLRQQLYDWAVRAGSQLLRGEPVEKIIVGVYSDDLAPESKFSLNCSLVFSLDRK